MTHIDKNIDTKNGIKETNKRRLDELEKIIEKHTRSERHLEQNSGIVNSSQKNHITELQNEREEEIEHLKNLIVDGNDSDNDIDNLERNYNYTENYINNNESHMDSKTLKSTKEKQKHRKEQMNNLR